MIETVSDSYFRVIFISENYSHNQMIFFCFVFSIHWFLLWLWEVGILGFTEIFRKYQEKNSVMESVFSNASGFITAKNIFLRIFLKLSKKLISRANLNNYFWAYVLTFSPRKTHIVRFSGLFSFEPPI